MEMCYDSRDEIYNAGVYMKNIAMRIKENIHWIALAAFLVSLVPIAAIAPFDQPSADDYLYGTTTNQVWQATHSLGAVLVSAWNNMIHTWWTWDGNYFSTFIGSLQPAVFDLYFLVPFIVGGSLIIGTCYFIHVLLKDYLGANRQQIVLTTVIVLCLFIEFLPSAVQGLFWYDGAISYTFIHGLALLMFGVLIKAYKTEGKNKRIRLFTLAVILGFLVSGGNFIDSLVAILIMTVAAFVLWRLKKANPIPSLLVWASLVGGFVLSICAPGNYMRQWDMLKTIKTQPTVPEAIRDSFVSGFQYGLSWLTLPVVFGLIMLVLVLIPLARKHRSWSFPAPALVLALAFCIYCAGFAPSIYAQGVSSLVWETRITNMLYFNEILLIGFSAFYLAGWMFHRRMLGKLSFFDDLNFSLFMKKATPWIAGAAVILFALTVPGLKNPSTSLSALGSLTDGSAQQYADQSLKREYVYENSTESQVVVSSYTVKPYVLYYDDIKTDSNDWRNRGVAKYYNKETVSVM